MSADIAAAYLAVRQAAIASLPSEELRRLPGFWELKQQSFADLVGLTLAQVGRLDAKLRAEDWAERILTYRVGAE